MNDISNSVAMQQQPNPPPLPPTRLPMRYPNRRRRRPVNVDSVLGGNGFYPNIGGNGFYSNIGGNGFYSNIRGYGYYPPFENSNYNCQIIDRPRNYRRNIFDNRNYLLQQPYLYYNQSQEAVVMPRGRFYRQKEQRRGSSSRLGTQSNRRRSRSDQRQSRFRQEQRRRRPRQLRLNDFMPSQLRDTSPTTTTTINLPNQFNLGEKAATSTTITAPPEALPQRECFRVNNVTQPFTVD